MIIVAVGVIRLGESACRFNLMGKKKLEVIVGAVSVWDAVREILSLFCRLTKVLEFGEIVHLRHFPCLHGEERTLYQTCLLQLAFSHMSYHLEAF